MTSSWHHFLYGASRTGKTTLAAQVGVPTLAVTMEPQVTAAAFGAAGNSDVVVWQPPTPEDLFVFLDYPKEYLGKNLEGFTPNLVLFDNLQGLQHLIIGRPSKPKQTVGGLEIPPTPATGIIGAIPKGSDVSNPEALSQAQYGVLGRYTRRLLNAIDSLPYNTIITSTEQYDFDEKYKKDSQGRKPQDAAGRPRSVRGYPSTEGSMTKAFLAACVSGAFLHLAKDEKTSKYFIHHKTHTDSQNVEWFADSRGLSLDAESPLDWTEKNGAELLKLS